MAPADDPPPGAHASVSLARRRPRLMSASTPAPRPSTPMISAMIVSSETRRRRASLRLDRRRGRLGGLRPRPVHDRPVGIGLLDLERVGLRRGRLGEELKQRVLAGRGLAARPGHLRDHRAIARAGLLHLLGPAGRRRDERVDPEPVRDGHHDLVGRQPLLLGRDGEAVELQLPLTDTAGLTRACANAAAGRNAASASAIASVRPGLGGMVFIDGSSRDRWK